MLRCAPCVLTGHDSFHPLTITENNTMNTHLNLTALSLVALMGLSALTACSQKTSTEEIAAQVKIALEQEKAKEAAAAQTALTSPVEAPANVPVGAPEPAKKEVAPKHAVVQAKHVAHEQPAAALPVVEQKPVCGNCGVVVSVDMIEVAGKGSGLGVVGGGVIGGLLGNQVGDGTGRDLATLAGAVGGAFAGNAIEKNARKTKSYAIVVKMDDGAERTYHQATVPSLVSGEKVKIENDAVVRN